MTSVRLIAVAGLLRSKRAQVYLSESVARTALDCFSGPLAGSSTLIVIASPTQESWPQAENLNTQYS